MNELCHPSTGALVLAGLYLADSLLEYWLGKTSKFKAASKWELIFTGAVAAAVLLLSRKEKKKEELENGN